MLSVLAIILLIALVVWLIAQFLPRAAMAARVALVVWVVTATFMLLDAHIDM